MKKFILFIVVCIFLLVGCTQMGVETDYPAAIMVDGEVYLKHHEPMAGDVDESSIIGKTTAYTDAYPEKDGETNFNKETGMSYARVEGGIAVLYENEWHLCTPENVIPGGAKPVSDWGITLSAENVTPTGLTVVYTQSGGEPSGDLQTGSYFIIEKRENNSWIPVDYVMQEHEVSWTEEAWIMPLEDTISFETEWEWLYGALPEGEYRIGKEYIDFIETGNFTKQMYYAEFSVEDDFPLMEDAKPVIYLYPEQVTNVSVKLDYSGEFIFTYPTYENGWNVTAYPDGKVISDGKEYSYLFWDGHSDTEYDLSEGFVVKGEDTEEFLVENLQYLGLTPKEYNEFIVFWLPKMVNNEYNLITFQGDAYTQSAVLTIEPKPDSIGRVFMVFKAIDEEIQIPEQTLVPFEREGFTVIEWGGAEIVD